MLVDRFDPFHTGRPGEAPGIVADPFATSRSVFNPGPIDSDFCQSTLPGIEDAISNPMVSSPIDVGTQPSVLTPKQPAASLDFADVFTSPPAAPDVTPDVPVLSPSADQSAGPEAMVVADGWDTLQRDTPDPEPAPTARDTDDERIYDLREFDAVKLEAVAERAEPQRRDVEAEDRIYELAEFDAVVV
jgi:hypothetical protein